MEGGITDTEDTGVTVDESTIQDMGATDTTVGMEVIIDITGEIIGITMTATGDTEIGMEAIVTKGIITIIEEIITTAMTVGDTVMPTIMVRGVRKEVTQATTTTRTEDTEITATRTFIIKRIPRITRATTTIITMEITEGDTRITIVTMIDMEEARDTELTIVNITADTVTETIPTDMGVVITRTIMENTAAAVTTTTRSMDSIGTTEEAITEEVNTIMGGTIINKVIININSTDSTADIDRVLNEFFKGFSSVMGTFNYLEVPQPEIFGRVLLTLVLLFCGFFHPPKTLDPKNWSLVVDGIFSAVLTPAEPNVAQALAREKLDNEGEQPIAILYITLLRKLRVVQNELSEIVRYDRSSETG